MKSADRLPGSLPLALEWRDLGAAGLAAVAIGALALGGTFDEAEEGSLDLRFQLRGPRNLNAPVAVVAIDESSLAKLGQMPWSRKVFARLLDRLREAKARAVAFDVAFTEPGAREAGEDAALQAALTRFGPVVLAVFRPLESGHSAAPALVKPLPALGGAASGFGLAHFGRSAELSIHRVETQQPAGDAVVPTLGLALARAFLGTGYGLGIATDRPTAAAGMVPPRIVLDYAGPPGQIPALSAAKVLADKDPPLELKDNLVVIGATAAGLPDTGFRGAFPGLYSGAELHATVAENMLSAGGIRQLPAPTAAALWLLLAAIGGWPLAATRPAPALRLGVLAGSLAAIGAGAVGLFGQGIWLPVIAPAVLLAGCALAGILRQEGALLRERARLLGWYAEDVAREAKRQRELIDGELHDEAQQLLVVMSREARKVEKTLGAGKLGAIPELLARTLDEIIRVRKALVPHTLARKGFKVAAEEMVREAAARAHATVELEDDGWPDGVDPLLENALYWLVREALNNALEHAEARRVILRLGSGKGSAWVAVADDGKGFVAPPLDRPPQTHEHTGLHRMWVRARGLGGAMTVVSRPGSGATVTFRIPLRKKADGSLSKEAHL